MGLFDKLLRDGAEAAASVIAAVVVTGEDIIVGAERKRQNLGEAFDKRAERTMEKLAQTHDNLAKAVDDHIEAFAEALDTAFNEIDAERRKRETPAPQANVSEATPDAVAKTKPKLKVQKEGPAAQAKPKARTRGGKRTKKPTL